VALEQRVQILLYHSAVGNVVIAILLYYSQVVLLASTNNKDLASCKQQADLKLNTTTNTHKITARYSYLKHSNYNKAVNTNYEMHKYNQSYKHYKFDQS